MSKIKAKAAAIINARAEDVYTTLADYRHGHPKILPPKNLYDLQVEQGGYGAGTIIRFKSRLLGVEQSFRQRVSEPEPGHILIERDIDTVQDECSTFTVTPVEQGQKTHFEILTTVNPDPGLKGLIERIVVPLFLSPVLRDEIQRMEKVAQQRGSASLTASGQSL